MKQLQRLAIVLTIGLLSSTMAFASYVDEPKPCPIVKIGAPYYWSVDIEYTNCLGEKVRLPLQSDNRVITLRPQADSTLVVKDSHSHGHSKVAGPSWKGQVYHNLALNASGMWFWGTATVRQCAGKTPDC